MQLAVRHQLVVFMLLFSGGMWMSKMAQPLYFQHHGALIAFGIGYAVMAVVGGFSFVWGAIADRVGGVQAMRVGTVLYAIGISGRLLTGLVPSIVFSAIAGAGASLVLVAIRPWVRRAAAEEEIPKIVAARNLGNQVGVLIGTVGAAVIFGLVADQAVGERIALVAAPVLVVLGLGWAMTAVKVPQRPLPADPSTSAGEATERVVGLSVKLMAIGLLTGFYVSLVGPYLPLILTAGRGSAAQAAVVIALMSGAQVVASWSLTRRGMRVRPTALFFTAELVTALATFAAAGLIGIGGVWLAAIFILRAAFVAIAIAAEETIQYAVIPLRAAGLVFGISQSAFLVGDALGGALGAPLWLAAGAKGLLIVAGAVTLLNACVLPTLLRSPRVAVAPGAA